MLAKIEIETTRAVDDATGRTLLTFRPIFTPDVTAHGYLSFAIWQVWLDEPQTHDTAKLLALTNARACLSAFSNQKEGG